MRSLFVSLLIATFIVIVCGAFAFPGSAILSTLSRAAIALVLFGTFSVALLLIPEHSNRRQAFVVGSLLPVFCLVFGNVEILKALAGIYESLSQVTFGISSRNSLGLFVGTAIVALANGLLTFVFFEAFQREAKQE